MLAWQVLADGALRELRPLDLRRRCAAGLDWRGVGEKAGRSTGHYRQTCCAGERSNCSAAPLVNAPCTAIQTTLRTTHRLGRPRCWPTAHTVRPHTSSNPTQRECRSLVHPRVYTRTLRAKGLSALRTASPPRFVFLREARTNPACARRYSPSHEWSARRSSAVDITARACNSAQ